MNRIRYCLLVVALLLATESAMAARIYTVDPQSGETTVIEQGGGEEETAEEKPAVCPEDEREIRRLRELVRRQQKALAAQQRFISRLQSELRHKDNIIMGLDQLRRQGR